MNKYLKIDLSDFEDVSVAKTEKVNLLHAPTGKVVGKTNKITFKDGSVRYYTDEELSTGKLKDF